LVIYGMALMVSASTAVLFGWVIATCGGIFFVQIFRAMFTGEAVVDYLKARVEKKVNLSNVSGRKKLAGVLNNELFRPPTKKGGLATALNSIERLSVELRSPYHPCRPCHPYQVHRHQQALQVLEVQQP